MVSACLFVYLWFIKILKKYTEVNINSKSKRIGTLGIVEIISMTVT